MITIRSIAIAALVLVGTADTRAQEAVARYAVVFDATWSLATHPFATPPGPHFSALVGGSHDAGVAFWQEGALATQGIEEMAELGLPFSLQAEINAAIATGHAHDVAIGDGPESPGSGQVQIEATLAHPLATVVSMVAPSPDWFVGVSGIPLLVNGAWVDQLVVELHAYDAGTDTGTEFLSPDADAQPQVAIALLGYPFVNTPPLGTFTFVRLPGGGVCDDGVDNDGDGAIDLADLGCRDSAWPTESPECSDGINNDPGMDAGIDFDGGASQNGGVAIAVPDSQCSAPWQRRESPQSCGLGFEMAPLLAGIGYAMRRARRRVV